ncbi:MAG TPA: MFS transporter [Symbiobacteriaceae bacterium]|nr:MFS transporter [Symbiobacteriaceae bacterium]
MLATLRNRSFALLWLGQLVSRLGDGLYEIALVWMVYEGTGSSFAASGVFIAFALPTLIFSLFGGVLADRINRKYILVGCDWVRGVLLLAAALILGSSKISTVQAYVITFVLSSVARFFVPAYTSTVPQVLPKGQLAAASALNKLSGMAADILGPVLGGVLVAIMSPAAVLVADGLTFLVAGVLTAFIALPPLPARPADEAEKQTSLWADMREGIRAVVDDGLIVSLVTLVAILNLLLSPLNVVLPRVAELIGTGSASFGLMAGTLAAGSAISALTTPRLHKQYGGRTLIVAGTLLMALSFFGLAAAPGLLWAILPLFVMVGICVMLIQIPAVVILQEHVPNHLLGRVASTLEMVSQAAIPLGSAAAGLFTDQFNVRWFFLVVSLLVLSTGLFFRNQMRRLAQEGVVHG